jgi:hypothetical protein
MAVWLGSGSVDWHAASNWSPAAVPDYTTDVYFNNQASGECRLTSSGFCKDFTASGDFPYNFSASGQDIWVSGSFTYDGTGALTLD